MDPQPAEEVANRLWEALFLMQRCSIIFAAVCPSLITILISGGCQVYNMWELTKCDEGEGPSVWFLLVCCFLISEANRSHDAPVHFEMKLWALM